MSKSLQRTALIALISASAMFALPGQTLAWSCQSQYEEAERLIEKAENLVADDTDSRILAMLEQAKGLADSGIVSHAKASEGHTGEVGKFMHGNAMRQAAWAQELAKQAYFLLTTETY